MPHPSRLAPLRLSSHLSCLRSCLNTRSACSTDPCSFRISVDCEMDCEQASRWHTELQNSNVKRWLGNIKFLYVWQIFDCVNLRPVCLTSFLSPPCEVILLPLFTLHVNFTPKGNQDDDAGQGFRLPRMASGFNRIFIKQRRSAKNGAELDKLPHETLKVESLNLVLKKSAKPERFPFRISSAQLNTS